MNEIRLNLHIHTTFSDGSKTHLGVIRDAVDSGMDAIIFTDHNVYVDGIEKYYEFNGSKILVIMGEEIHDPTARPQKNHMLALGAGVELASFAYDRKTLIAKIQAHDGGAFLAHPYDPAMPDFHEPDISWTDWSVEDYDGIELWNGFSELKVRTNRKIDAFLYAFFPKFLPQSPPAETMTIWNKLLNSGKIIFAIAGSDAHALHYTAGPFRQVIFPYRYHFSTINNHILLSESLDGDFDHDKRIVIDALKQGRNFIANDLLANARGFRFNIVKQNSTQFEMGQIGIFDNDLSLEVNIPDYAEVHIVQNGQAIRKISGKGLMNFPISSSGVYRVECFRKSRGVKRGWIFSNPIYVR